MVAVLGVVTCETAAQCLRAERYMEALVGELVFSVAVLVVAVLAIWNLYQFYQGRPS